MPAKSANESTLERVVRVGIGVVFLALVFIGPHAGSHA